MELLLLEGLSMMDCWKNWLSFRHRVYHIEEKSLLAHLLYFTSLHFTLDGCTHDP